MLGELYCVHLHADAGRLRALHAALRQWRRRCSEASLHCCAGRRRLLAQPALHALGLLSAPVAEVRAAELPVAAIVVLAATLSGAKSGGEPAVGGQGAASAEAQAS